MSGWLTGLALVVAVLPSGQGHADSVDARCDVYPTGEDRASAVVPCVFSQRQGAVSITLDDGTRYELLPVGTEPGNFQDSDGNRVYRQSGLGRAGQIFRFPDSSIYVYWDSSALHTAPDDVDNPTAPYSTADYDATTLLRCQASESAEMVLCPAGILRMEDRQASLVVRSPAGEEFTINFMTGYVNATGRKVVATMAADTWTVVIDGVEIYQVPLAAIEGG